MLAVLFDRRGQSEDLAGSLFDDPSGDAQVPRQHRLPGHAWPGCRPWSGPTAVAVERAAVGDETLGTAVGVMVDGASIGTITLIGLRLLRRS